MSIAAPFFQAGDVQHLDQWHGLAFNDCDNDYFERQTASLSDAFETASRDGGLLRFVVTYTAASRQMLDRTDQPGVLGRLLEDALRRLVVYYLFIRRRSRPWLAVDGSVHQWQLSPKLIERARSAAARPGKDGVRAVDHGVEVRDYDLDNDPALKRWVMDNIHPILREYTGSWVVLPSAQIRDANADRPGSSWASLFKDSPYGNFHFDELLYALPLIVYLSDVDETNGPFSYVEGSDKLPQNLVLRAFHQAVSHGLGLTASEQEEREAIARLPGVFRGGDRIGQFVPKSKFQILNIHRCVGSAGTAILSDGFQLLHEGGFPALKSRQALFVIFRYPKKRLEDLAARAATAYWRWQVRPERPTHH